MIAGLVVDPGEEAGEKKRERQNENVIKLLGQHEVNALQDETNPHNKDTDQNQAWFTAYWVRMYVSDTEKQTAMHKQHTIA